MGYNTVVVLYNDQTDRIASGGHSAARMASAISHGWLERKRDPMAVDFGVGMVVSQAHADEEQVVIVSQNSGCRAQDATELGWQALAVMAECLERHGYTVTKKRKTKLSPDDAEAFRMGGDR